MAHIKNNDYPDSIREFTNSTDVKDANQLFQLYINENKNLAKELTNFKHDTLNIFHCISCYIESEDWNGLKVYFNNILEKSKKAEDPTMTSIEKIKNPSLKELVYLKLADSSNQGIDFRVMIDENIFIKSHLINESDLCIVINEFLHNAIETASKAKIKRVSIYILNNNNSTSIIIESTFKEKPPMISKVTKPSFRNIFRKARLHPSKSILQRSPHILNNAYIQHQFFIQELQILNK